MHRTVRFGIRILLFVLLAEVCNAAEPSGNYIAQLTRGTAAPQYARVNLTVAGARVSGSWNEYSIDGIITGTRIDLKLTQKDGRSAGQLSGEASGDDFAGQGSMLPPAGNRGAFAGSANLQPVSWKLTAYHS